MDQQGSDRHCLIMIISNGVGSDGGASGCLEGVISYTAKTHMDLRNTADVGVVGQVPLDGNIRDQG
jgi:hypothetical protein